MAQVIVFIIDVRAYLVIIERSQSSTSRGKTTVNAQRDDSKIVE
jgi:hypothetical protein